MIKTSVSYDEVGMLSTLTRDYIKGNPTIRNLYNLESNFDNVRAIIDQKSLNSSVNRELLVKVLSHQYADLKPNKKVLYNIQSLKADNTFTITTGHQLNLFTGPLYFVYKIVSVIKMSDDLKKRYPEYNFVPVYWMATEDHDFEEINHTFVADQKLQWNSDQSGMVGEFSTDEIDVVLEQLKSILDHSVFSEELIRKLREAYIKHQDLSNATRCLVNGLFEKFGLIIIDANDTLLKKSFSKVVKDELIKGSSYNLVERTIKDQFKSYKVQVNPREINLFYASNGIRERIIKEGDVYHVNNTDVNFDEISLLNELNKHPERFSPNVILRPLYQEYILPNIMYIGGGAEVAYWLQLKSVFDYHKVVYPLLQIRNSFGIQGAKNRDKMKAFGLRIDELFENESHLEKKVFKGGEDFSDEIALFSQVLKDKLKDLTNQVKNVDRNLEKSIEGRKKRIENELNKMEKTIFRSVKRRNQDQLNRLRNLKSELFPNGTFQERRVNIIDMLRIHGDGFIDVIYEETESFNNAISILNI